jgi:hypothetical protein
MGLLFGTKLQIFDIFKKIDFVLHRVYLDGENILSVKEEATDNSGN